MLSFFPPPYPDETMYSIIGRYHRLNANPSSVNTMKELFNSKSTPPVYFPSGLDYLTQQIQNQPYYNNDYFIYNHTILKFFKPFLEMNRWLQIVSNLKSNEAKKVQFSLGFTTSSNVLRLKGLKICQQCIVDDTELYGEAYFHVNHQIPGNYVCYKHNEWLHILDALHVVTQRKFIYPDSELFRKINLFDSEVKKFFYAYAEDVACILQANFDEGFVGDITKKYISKLCECGLQGKTGRILYKKLQSLLHDYYPSKLLEQINYSFTTSKLYSLLYANSSVTHPFIHIMLIRFLFGSFQKLLDYKVTSCKPFEDAPFPCLNPVCDNYKKDVIGEYLLSNSGGAYIGTFSCECGFKYTRIGPDINGDKRYEYSKIVKHGELWDKTLKEYVLGDKYSRKEIAERIGSKLANIHGYIKRIKDNPEENFHSKQSYQNEQITKSIKKSEKMEIYKNEMLDLIKSEPNITRTMIANKLRIQYSWLAFYNKDLLQDILSPIGYWPIKNRDRKRRLIINWQERDEEYFQKANLAIENMKNSEKPARITLNAIQKEISIEIGWMLSKLPKTQLLIKNSLENIEDYRIRKINYVVAELLKAGMPIKREAIFRKAHLPYRPGMLTDYVENIIRKYNE